MAVVDRLHDANLTDRRIHPFYEPIPSTTNIKRYSLSDVNVQCLYNVRTKVAEFLNANADIFPLFRLDREENFKIGDMLKKYLVVNFALHPPRTRAIACLTS